MPFTRSAVEIFISKRAAAVTSCGLSDLATRVPASTKWLTQLGLSIMFHDHPPAHGRPILIDVVRRIAAAFQHHALARSQILDFVRDGHGRWSPYFAALTHLEVLAAQLYIPADLVRKLSGTNFFKTGDGSFGERLGLIYNSSKHEPPASELALWFTNDSIACHQAAITFEELEAHMAEMAEVIDLLSNRDRAVEAFQKLAHEASRAE